MPHITTATSVAASATLGMNSLEFLATSFDASLSGRWREHVVMAHRYLSEKCRRKMNQEHNNERDVHDDDTTESDESLCLVLRKATLSIQAVRVSPKARSRLLSDALCPKPWSSDVLLFVLLAMMDTLMPEDSIPSTRGNTIFTGRVPAHKLSDLQTYICAMTLSHECTTRLDMSNETTWNSYRAFERRLYRMVLFTDASATCHSAVCNVDVVSGKQDQVTKKTVLIHTMAAISASVWRRRVSHVTLRNCTVADVEIAIPQEFRMIKAMASVHNLLASSYREWFGVRFCQSICKGRANSLCRSHDREIFSFLSNGVAGSKSTLNESVDAAFMNVPQVLKAVLSDFQCMKQDRSLDSEATTGKEELSALNDDVIVLYLANSLLKQRFGIPLADQYTFIEADVAHSIEGLYQTRYRAPCIVRGPEMVWGVMHWFDKEASFVPGSLISSDNNSLVAAITLWLVYYMQHMARASAGFKSSNLDFKAFVNTLY